MNTATCHTCRETVKRGDAVLRGDGVTQLAFHPACFTIYRAVKDVSANDVQHEHRVGMSLTERLQAAGYSV